MLRKKAPGIELPPVTPPKAVQPERKMTALAPPAHVNTPADKINAPAAKTKPPAAKTQAPAVPKTPHTGEAKQAESANGASLLNLNTAVNGSHAADRIAERAYFHWIERGCPFGSPEEDWLYAERELGLLH